MKTLISTVPFGEIDPEPVELLRKNGVDFLINPIGRKLKEMELAELLSDFEILIAGTEPVTARVMDSAPRLKLISRVGVGLDSVDLAAARERGVRVSYTPEAPAPAVAELAVGLMLNALRFVSQADRGLREGSWKRYMGRRLSECTVGVIGAGRIGKRVIDHLAGFKPRILVNDVAPDVGFLNARNVEITDKDAIYREADVITLHVPHTPDTDGLIDGSVLARLKAGAVLINTARGPIVKEQDLINALKQGALSAAAIDVYDEEPYMGELARLDNAILTCHMGSCSTDCRGKMEIEATKEALRLIHGEPLQSEVPESEYPVHGVKS
ncbi:MAG: lactate dehydrogenase [bacterium]|nr:lactate dehydrogenase [bacterium]